MKQISVRGKKLSSASLVLGFMGVVLSGGFLLCLPVSLNPGVKISLVDAMFISSSAVSTTGLTPIDFVATFSFFGQAVMAVLIYIGGLGVAVAGALIMMLLGSNLAGSQGNTLGSSISSENQNSIIKIVKLTFLYSTVIQVWCTVMLYFPFSQKFPVGQALWYSVFHAVSAYANAGMCVIEGSDNLAMFNGNLVVYFSMLATLRLGGHGYFVIHDITTKKVRNWSLHTKVALSVSTGLVLFVALMLWRFDKYNALDALFLSASATASGFTTTTIADMKPVTYLLLCFSMFIGAAPVSTGGGIRNTTFFILILALISTVRQQVPRAFNRRISWTVVNQAVSVLVMGSIFLFGSYFLLCLFEANTGLAARELFFECVSAFGSVGLSLGVTPYLSTASKIVLTVLMYLGRIGFLAFLGLFYKPKKDTYYVEGDIIIG